MPKKHRPSLETQLQLLGAGENKSGNEIKRRRFASKAGNATLHFFADLFSPASTSCPWVSEDGIRFNTIETLRGCSQKELRGTGNRDL